MPHTLIKTVYTFDELSEPAKETARAWWRGCYGQEEDWDCTIEDAEQCAALLGIRFRQQAIPLCGGGTRNKPVVYFSGFSSQGDGACFEGRYTYAKGACKAIREHAPQDKELHRIADALQSIQREAFYGLSATCRHSGHYNHSGCMMVDVERTSPQGADLGATEGQADGITQALRDFADWIYSQLEAEDEYRNADEQVDESILANEYEFDEDGSRAS